jgi:hypothetical protein
MGVHPFIEDPSSWVGTPWDMTKAPPPPDKSNAELIFDLHQRMQNGQNVADLFSDQRHDLRLRSGPIHPGAKKKLSIVSAPTPSLQDMAREEFNINPFTEELRSRRLPLEAAIPIVWKFPAGFCVKNLDGSIYLPLFCHGLRETADFLGVSFGVVAFQGLRDILRVHGPCGRVFRHLRHIPLPLRQALLFAVEAEMDSALIVAVRIIRALDMIVRCDISSTDPSIRGSVLLGLFDGGGSTIFSLIAAPLAAFRNRLISSKELARKEPRFTEMAALIFGTLTFFEENGGASSKRAISTAFPGGFAG